jgi:hypothetical protein
MGEQDRLCGEFLVGRGEGVRERRQKEPGGQDSWGAISDGGAGEGGVER